MPTFLCVCLPCPAVLPTPLLPNPLLAMQGVEFGGEEEEEDPELLDLLPAWDPEEKEKEEETEEEETDGEGDEVGAYLHCSLCSADGAVVVQ